MPLGWPRHSGSTVSPGLDIPWNRSTPRSPAPCSPRLTVVAAAADAASSPLSRPITRAQTVGFSAKSRSVTSPRTQAAATTAQSELDGGTALAIPTSDKSLPACPVQLRSNLQAVIVQAILSWQTQGPTLLAAVDSSGRTPLHFAALSRKFDIAKRLLDDHASLELASISDNNGSFPIHIPAMKGDTRTLCELIKRCPGYYELVDNQGRNLLHCAIKHGQDSVVRHICQNDKLAMLLNATDCEGNTPLHLAVECGNPRIVSLLLATLSVCMGITNKDGLTARDLCWIAIAPRQSNYFLVWDAQERLPRWTQHAYLTTNCTKFTLLLDPFVLSSLLPSLCRTSHSSAAVSNLSAARTGTTVLSPVLTAVDIAAGPEAIVVRPTTLRLPLALYVFDRMSDPVFCDLFAEKAMNSDASSDDEYGPIELDKRIKAKCFDSSDSDE
ncbi:hypothetical protein D1007_47016 [Hordeum vulgare]|nr:hypothetical protein D1007_47016 [Hordeum vulgare]